MDDYELSLPILSILILDVADCGPERIPVFTDLPGMVARHHNDMGVVRDDILDRWTRPACRLNLFQIVVFSYSTSQYFLIRSQLDLELGLGFDQWDGFYHLWGYRIRFS